MAWMRMMGADSVAYHEDNVAGRADDHAGAALAYYGSRGETPLAWGGSGRSTSSASRARSTAERTGRCSGRAAPAAPHPGAGWWRRAGRAWSWWCRRTSRWRSWG